VFTSSDFVNTAARATVDQTLSRLTKQGVIRRLTQGLYDYPRTHEKLGALSPPPDAIAAAIARRDNVRIQPSGEAASNALGLSTQVPAKNVYLTDGRSRIVRAGTQEIEFRHVPPGRLLPGRGAAPLAASAMGYVGRDAEGQRSTKRTLVKTLKPRDRRKIAKTIRYMPTWMHKIARDISRGDAE
jgi:hypothetical protein